MKRLTKSEIDTIWMWLDSCASDALALRDTSRQHIIRALNDLEALRAAVRALPEPVMYEDWEPLGCVMCDGPLNVDRTIDHAPDCPWAQLRALAGEGSE